MTDIDQVIFNLFDNRWVGESVTKDLESMRRQLHKTLSNQVDGYWSGHTAYHIAVDGGFLIDSKTGTKKVLTEFGRMFMDAYSARGEKQDTT